MYQFTDLSEYRLGNYRKRLAFLNQNSRFPGRTNASEHSEYGLRFPVESLEYSASND